MNSSYDVIVIGAGAAGLMAAHTASLYGKRVLLIEKNDRVGKKLMITGKGRCNVTNNCDVSTVLNNVTVNNKFLYSSLNRFSPADTMAYFENAGVELKTERGNRVFPQSDKAKDIVDALKNNVRSTGVEILNDTVISVLCDENVCTGVECKNTGVHTSKSVILATGGKSYSATGSNGEGYLMAKRLGHNIVTPKPSLVPIVTKEDFCKKAQGLSLKNVRLDLFDAKLQKNLYSELGEMLFTHFGVSGPLVLSASAHIKDIQQNRYKLKIDLKPALSEQKLDERILRDFSENLNRDFQNSLGALLPRKLIPVIITLSGIPFDIKVNQITKNMRENLVRVIKCLELTVKEFRPIEEAIITSGGIDTSQINPKTMESKLVSGLFFAGEIIDVDAYTGGFNLQIAFSTGFVSGENS